jgi:hypothetical protein
MKIEDVTGGVNAKFELALNHDIEWFKAERGVTSKTKYLQNYMKVLNSINGTEIRNFKEKQTKQYWQEKQGLGVSY